MRSPQDYIDLEVPPGQSIDRVWLRENISTGQRAHSFRVLVAHKQDDGLWLGVASVNGVEIARCPDMPGRIEAIKAAYSAAGRR